MVGGRVGAAGRPTPRLVPYPVDPGPGHTTGDGPATTPLQRTAAAGVGGVVEIRNIGAATCPNVKVVNTNIFNIF